MFVYHPSWLGRAVRLMFLTAITSTLSGASAWAAESNWLAHPVTDNVTFDTKPAVHGGAVLWRGWSGASYDIFQYEGGNTVNLSNSSSHNEDTPDVGEYGVVWFRSGQIYYHDGQQIQMISSGPYNDMPAICGSNIVWSGDDGGSDREIFMYDMQTRNTIQLTTNGIDDRDPRVSDQNVVWWQGNGGPNDQVMLYDGNLIMQITPVGSTFHNGGGRSPDISGTRVVYVGNDGGADDDIFIYEITTGQTERITTSDYTELTPRISGTGLVWTGVVEGSDYEIFYHDLLTDETFQLTDNDGLEQRWPQISDTQIAWRGFDGVDYEIYAVQVPEPTTLLLLALGGLEILWRRRNTCRSPMLRQKQQRKSVQCAWCL